MRRFPLVLLSMLKRPCNLSATSTGSHSHSDQATSNRISGSPLNVDDTHFGHLEGSVAFAPNYEWPAAPSQSVRRPSHPALDYQPLPRPPSFPRNADSSIPTEHILSPIASSASAGFETYPEHYSAHPNAQVNYNGQAPVPSFSQMDFMNSDPTRISINTGALNAYSPEQPALDMMSATTSGSSHIDFGPVHFGTSMLASPIQGPTDSWRRASIMSGLSDDTSQDPQSTTTQVRLAINTRIINAYTPM
ncbi:hypothetical protein PLICRDRAFT_297944 [Plicaturopsis crispa FD-325 SS-3]|nr:hypothetical protein PLICRDRAFT_297944 [Plicaturopsis crispa FD-325 SS-3]